MHGQTEVALIFLITILLIVWIVIERAKLREMASSRDKNKLAILLGVAIFIAALNSIVFSLVTVVILDSVHLAIVIGDFGMFAFMVVVPIIPSWLVSTIILRNRKWAYLTILLASAAGLYIVLSCFYCVCSPC